MVELGEKFYYGVAGVQLRWSARGPGGDGRGGLPRSRTRLAGAHVRHRAYQCGDRAGQIHGAVRLGRGAGPGGGSGHGHRQPDGGIIPEAIVILTLVTLAVSLLGCSLAIALSVRATRAHEVLMVVFAIWSSGSWACRSG